MIIKNLWSEQMLGQIIIGSTDYFDKITRLPSKVRFDPQERTGIQIILKESGAKTLINESIYFPSKEAIFYAGEKITRSEIYNLASSQEGENPSKFRYRGSITVKINGRTFWSSTSGLTGDEDVLNSILNMSCWLGITVDDVIRNVLAHKGGLMPDSFSDKDHYLHKMIVGVI